MPHHENERQRSINDFCSGIMGNLGGNRLHIVINWLLTTFIGKSESETLPAPSSKWASTECQRLLAFHHGLSQRGVAVIVYIHRFDCYYTLKGSRILSGSSVNEISCYCPRGCGLNIPYISAYKGCHILLYGWLWSRTTHITEDARPNIVDSLLMLIFRMWLGAWVFLFCTSRRLIRRKWTVTYRFWYFTINSSVSECNHKCETRNAEPEIGTDASSQTQRNLQVHGYGSGFGPPSICGSDFWTGLEPNWPVFAVRTWTTGGLPEPVASTILGIVISVLAIGSTLLQDGCHIHFKQNSKQTRRGANQPTSISSKQTCQWIYIPRALLMWFPVLIPFPIPFPRPFPSVARPFPS